MRKRQLFKMTGLERLEDRVVLRGGPTLTSGAITALINQAYGAFKAQVQQDIVNFTNDLDGASNNGGIPVVIGNPALQQFLPSGNPNPRFNQNANPFVFANPVPPQQALINYANSLAGQINTLARQLNSGLNVLGVRPANRTLLTRAIAAQVTGVPTDGVSFGGLPQQGSLFRTLLSTGPLDAKAAQPRIVQFQNLANPNAPEPGTIVPNTQGQRLVNLVGQSSLNAIDQSKLALTIQAVGIARISRAIHGR